jgi:hypothetical protein
MFDALRSSRIRIEKVRFDGGPERDISFQLGIVIRMYAEADGPHHMPHIHAYFRGARQQKLELPVILHLA